MTVWIFRLILILSLAGAGYQTTQVISIQSQPAPGQYGILAGVGLALLLIILEVLFSRRPIRSISAVIFGVIAGCVMAFMLYGVVLLAVGKTTHELFHVDTSEDLKRTSLLFLVPACCYLGVVLIYKTRDRFRFVIPYVEFRREAKGVRPILLDTSAIVDGRIGEVAGTGVLDGPLLVPRFVLQELHSLADSADGVRRRRGRRGLDMLQRLQRDERVDIELHDGQAAVGADVDTKIVSLAGALGASIITCDYNLSKIAELQGVATINLNDLANSLRPVATVDEELEVKVIRGGDEPGQGVGFLPDGTMVVIEGSREKIGQNVRFIVTNVLQTSAGRMIFGRLRDQAGRDKP